MRFTREIVFAECKKQAPLYGFEPELIQAICLQEGENYKRQLQRHLKTAINIGDKKFEQSVRELIKQSDGTEFAPDVARLEPYYYLKYVEYQVLPTTSEVLLSASYGVMQEMGQELKRMGFFLFYFNECNDGIKNVIKAPISQFAIPSGIDAFCEKVEWQIAYGCKLLKEKLDRAGGNLNKAIDNYNGDQTGKYRAEVMLKYKALKG